MPGAICHCISFAALMLLCAPLMAENWPGFRGPGGQGMSAETSLPVRWSASDNVRWKTAIPGEGHSSPIVHGDKIFVTASSDNGRACQVICIDRDSGRILWNSEGLRQEPGPRNPRNSHATPTPVTDGRRVYALFSSGAVAAVAFDGRLEWTNRDNDFFGAHGLAASPILFEDLLIIQYDGSSRGPDKVVGHQKPWDQSYVIALDTATGRPRWKAMRGMSRIGHVTPRILDVNGQPQLISAAGDVVQGYEPRTGKKLWWVRSQGEGVVPSIVAADNMLFTASGFEKPTIRAIRIGGGEGDLTATHIAWENNRAVPMIPSFVHVNGCLFAIKESGMVFCLNPADGQIIWQQRIEGTYAASPVCAENRIYMLSDEGETTVIEAGREFKLLATNALGEKCQASPAISGGRIFIRSLKHLYCIGQ